MQQQLSTNPVVDNMSILAVLLREVQKSEIHFPIPIRSVDWGA